MASQKATKKKVVKKEKKQDNIEEFVNLAKDLKDIVLDLNTRVSELESVFNRIRTRLGL